MPVAPVLRAPGWKWLVTNVAIAVVFARALFDLAQLALSEETYSHIGLIPLIYLWLLYRLRGELARTELAGTGQAKPTARAVAALAVFAMVVTALAWWTRDRLVPVDHLSLLMLAFVPALWASWLWYFGAAGFRIALFPQLFLLFLVPVPQELLDVFIRALLWGSTLVTQGLFQLTGVPHFQNGAVFILPGLSIEIAKECSGIRSTMALVITGLLAGYLALRTGWARLLLVALLFPLAVFKNGLRIVALSLLTIHVDPGFIEGDLHRKGGVVFFGITLAVMAGLVWVIQRMEGLKLQRFRGSRV